MASPLATDGALSLGGTTVHSSKQVVYAASTAPALWVSLEGCWKESSLDPYGPRGACLDGSLPPSLRAAPALPRGGAATAPAEGDVGTVLEGDCALRDWVTLAESRVARPTAATVHERAGGLELDVLFTLSHEEFSFALVRNSNNQK